MAKTTDKNNLQELWITVRALHLINERVSDQLDKIMTQLEDTGAGIQDMEQDDTDEMARIRANMILEDLIK